MRVVLAWAESCDATVAITSRSTGDCVRAPDIVRSLSGVATCCVFVVFYLAVLLTPESCDGSSTEAHLQMQENSNCSNIQIHFAMFLLLGDKRLVRFYEALVFAS